MLAMAGLAKECRDVFVLFQSSSRGETFQNKSRGCVGVAERLEFRTGFLQTGERSPLWRELLPLPSPSLLGCRTTLKFYRGPKAGYRDERSLAGHRGDLSKALRLVIGTTLSRDTGSPTPALLCRGRAGRNYVRSYLLNCLGTRSEPHNPSFTVAGPQLNLGQPRPCTLSVRGLWLWHKTIQRELQHEKPLHCKGELSFGKFAKGEAIGHKVFSVPFCFPSQAPSTLLYAPPHLQPRPQSNQTQKLLNSVVGGWGVLCQGVLFLSLSWISAAV